MSKDPLTKTKADYQEIIDKISSADSPVGLDTQYTHAVIIAYLRQIAGRLDKLEQTVLKSRGR